MDKMVILVGVGGEAQHLLKDGFVNPFPDNKREVTRISSIAFHEPSQTFGITLLGNLHSWNDEYGGYPNGLDRKNLKWVCEHFGEAGIGHYLNCMKLFYEMEGEHNEEAIQHLRFKTYENAVRFEVLLINSLRESGYKFKAA